ncbi:hypothetical protein [Rhodovulum kholense]|uniref:Ca-activated chloride channel family protein n=1 Tax=Rhodovulum kholense TaxID=453584 RepID=A0A8E3AQJ9_9RHOB|nr:hypothetical protein [Rhodovulum kholense]PTW48274.1 Ca-activated chloride channel family protein [Rhodovulum kholense]
MKPRHPTATALACALACALLAGPQAWGKFLWRAGFPSLALPLIGDPAARAAALYDAGRHAEADAAVAALGRGATYNRGLTLAATGDYALSVAYFDAVLFANRNDDAARRNRDIVQALVPPVVGEAMGHGRIETILAEAGLRTVAFDPDAPDRPVLERETDPQRDSNRRPVTGERSAAADSAWLDTLEDAPGAYLRARLAAEMARRQAAGEAQEIEADRW